MKKELCLMHKDIEVASFTFNDSLINFSNITVYNQKHMPIGTQNPRGNDISSALKKWLKNRCIPNDRPNVGELLSVLHINDILELLMMDCHFCSLTDCYWFKSVDDNKIWNDVNFFSNGFNSNLGEILFFKDFSQSINNLHSPDITTNGALPKFWYKDNEEGFCLLKDGFRENQIVSQKQEVVAEIFAYELFKKYNIKATPYFFVEIENCLCSSCPNFIKNDSMEFVSMENVSQDLGGSKKMAYNKFCELGLKEKMDEIVILDFLNGNGDRHHNNIGYIRDPNTLEIVGLAPCFDNGAGMSYDYINGKAVEKAGAKLFYRDEIEELSLVDNFEFFKSSNITYEELSDSYKELSNGILKENVIEDVLKQFKNRYIFLKNK